MLNRNRQPLALKDCWLYAVASKADLARRLSTDALPFTVADLDMLSRDDRNFRLFDIEREGKKRGVQEPKPILQHLHSRVHKLLSRVEVPTYLHSAVRGKSYLSNARAHRSDVPMIKIDVKKFFQSVPWVAVHRFFKDTLSCRSDVAGLMADILTYDRHLPTGSSASPIMSYYAFKGMFDEIAALAARHGLTMTCYVDDITITGAGASKALLFEIQHIIAQHGLRSHKRRVFAASKAKVVTGVCNTKEGEQLPNKLHLKIYLGFQDLANAKSQEEALRLARPLLGRLEAARQIDPIFGKRARTLRASLRSRLDGKERV